MTPAIAALWNPSQALFGSRDLIANEMIGVGTSAGFLPLFADAASAEQAITLAGTLTAWADHVGYLIPSTDPSDAAFEPVRYWRGPIWSVRELDDSGWVHPKRPCRDCRAHS